MDTKDVGNFTLNNMTGVITVAEGGVLDREKQSVYSLMVQRTHNSFIISFNKLNLKAVTKVSDGDNGSLPLNSECPMARILVALLDENDNSPVFSLDVYNFTISDTILRNKPIGVVRFYDIHYFTFVIKVSKFYVDSCI